MSPLIERIEADISWQRTAATPPLADLLCNYPAEAVDDTPIRVLTAPKGDKGPWQKGSSKGRIMGLCARPTSLGRARHTHRRAVYRFDTELEGRHVLSHLADARGSFRADGYKGLGPSFNLLRVGGCRRFREAGLVRAICGRGLP